MDEFKSLKGIIPAVITPFTKHRKFDEFALRENVKFLINNGVHGIMVNGSTGEAANLSRKERIRVIEVAVDETDGKLPVIAGTGCPSTWQTIELTKDAKKAGADAAMVVTPFYLIPNEQGLITHYTQINKEISIPIVLYNIPQHTKVNLSPAIIIKLIDKSHNIMGLKDSAGDMEQLAETMKLTGDKISILSGCDNLLFQSFVLGVEGAIVALGNIAPNLIVELYELVKKKELDKAKNLYFKLLPIAKAIGSEYNFPAPVKEAVRLLGRPSGPTRNPIIPSTKEETERIKEALKYANLL